MSNLALDRRILAQILQNNHQAIRVFERTLSDVGSGLPSSIEEAVALATSTLAVAQTAMATCAVLADALAQLEGVPAALPQTEQDDTTPRAHLGTISGQNADEVEITGGTAKLATLALSGQMTSTVATGTPPLVVASATKVPNLHADKAATLANPTTYPADATDLASAIVLVNAIKAANISKGV